MNKRLHDVVAWGSLRELQDFRDNQEINHATQVAHYPGEVTPLQIAVIQRDIEKIDCLLSMGADVNLETRCHGTSLELAASKRYMEVVRYLRHRGAKVIVSSRTGDRLSRHSCFTDAFGIIFEGLRREVAA